MAASTFRGLAAMVPIILESHEESENPDQDAQILNSSPSQELSAGRLRVKKSSDTQLRKINSDHELTLPPLNNDEDFSDGASDTEETGSTSRGLLASPVSNTMPDSSAPQLLKARRASIMRKMGTLRAVSRMTRTATIQISDGFHFEYQLDNSVPLRCVTQHPRYLTPSGEQQAVTNNDVESTDVSSLSNNRNRLQLPVFTSVNDSNVVAIWDLTRRTKSIMHKPSDVIHISRRISRFIHIQMLNIYVATGEQRSIEIYDHRFEFISSCLMPSMVLVLQFCAISNELVACGPDTMMVYNIQCSNIRGATNVHLEPVRTLQVATPSNDWIQHLIIEHHMDRIYVATGFRILIYDRLNYELLKCINLEASRPITSLHFHMVHRYLIAGFKDGTIKVWNMSHVMIHEFHNHTKAVTGLCTYPYEPFLMSSSLDGSVRLWNLNAFLEIYSLNVRSPIYSLGLVDALQFYLRTETAITVLKYNHFHSELSIMSSEVTRLIAAWHPGIPPRVFAGLSDATCCIISPIDGSVLTLSLPYLDPDDMQDMVYSAKQDRYYLLTTTGEIWVIITNVNPCLVIDTWNSSNKSQREDVSCIQVYDGIHQEDKLRNKSTYFSQISNVLPDQTKRHYLLVGTSNGHILFMNKEGAIIYRYVAHPDQVRAMAVDSLTARLVSCGKDGSLRIAQIHAKSTGNDMVQTLATFSMNSPVPPAKICLLGYKTAVLTEDHVLHLFTFDPVTKRVALMVPHSKNDDHNEQVTAICSNTRLNVIVTASANGIVKVWDHVNSLLKEIKFRTPVHGLCFANYDGDLLIGLNRRIEVIPSTVYLPPRMTNVLLGDDRDAVPERPIFFQEQDAMAAAIRRKHGKKASLLDKIILTERQAEYLMTNLASNYERIEIVTMKQSAGKKSVSIPLIKQATVVTTKQKLLKQQEQLLAKVNDDVLYDKIKYFCEELEWAKMMDQEKTSDLDANSSYPALTSQNKLFNDVVHSSASLLPLRKSISIAFTMQGEMQQDAEWFSQLEDVMSNGTVDQLFADYEYQQRHFMQALETRYPIPVLYDPNVPVAPDGKIPNSILHQLLETWRYCYGDIPELDYIALYRPNSSSHRVRQLKDLSKEERAVAEKMLQSKQYRMKLARLMHVVMSDDKKSDMNSNDADEGERSILKRRDSFTDGTKQTILQEIQMRKFNTLSAKKRDAAMTQATNNNNNMTSRRISHGPQEPLAPGTVILNIFGDDEVVGGKLEPFRRESLQRRQSIIPPTRLPSVHPPLRRPALPHYIQQALSSKMVTEKDIFTVDGASLHQRLKIDPTPDGLLPLLTEAFEKHTDDEMTRWEIVSFMRFVQEQFGFRRLNPMWRILSKYCLEEIGALVISTDIKLRRVVVQTMCQYGQDSLICFYTLLLLSHYQHYPDLQQHCAQTLHQWGLTQLAHPYIQSQIEKCSTLLVKRAQYRRVFPSSQNAVSAVSLVEQCMNEWLEATNISFHKESRKMSTLPPTAGPNGTNPAANVANAASAPMQNKGIHAILMARKQTQTRSKVAPVPNGNSRPVSGRLSHAPSMTSWQGSNITMTEANNNNLPQVNATTPLPHGSTSLTGNNNSMEAASMESTRKGSVIMVPSLVETGMPSKSSLSRPSSATTAAARAESAGSGRGTNESHNNATNEICNSFHATSNTMQNVVPSDSIHSNNISPVPGAVGSAASRRRIGSLAPGSGPFKDVNIDDDAAHNAALLGAHQSNALSMPSPSVHSMLSPMPSHDRVTAMGDNSNVSLGTTSDSSAQSSLRNMMAETASKEANNDLTMRRRLLRHPAHPQWSTASAIHLLMSFLQHQQDAEAQRLLMEMQRLAWEKEQRERELERLRLLAEQEANERFIQQLLREQQDAEKELARQRAEEEARILAEALKEEKLRQVQENEKHNLSLLETLRQGQAHTSTGHNDKLLNRLNRRVVPLVHREAGSMAASSLTGTLPSRLTAAAALPGKSKKPVDEMRQWWFMANNQQPNKNKYRLMPIDHVMPGVAAASPTPKEKETDAPRDSLSEAPVSITNESAQATKTPSPDMTPFYDELKDLYFEHEVDKTWTTPPVTMANAGTNAVAVSLGSRLDLTDAKVILPLNAPLQTPALLREPISNTNRQNTPSELVSNVLSSAIHRNIVRVPPKSTNNASTLHQRKATTASRSRHKAIHSRYQNKTNTSTDEAFLAPAKEALLSKFTMPLNEHGATYTASRKYFIPMLAQVVSEDEEENGKKKKKNQDSKDSTKEVTTKEANALESTSKQVGIDENDVKQAELEPTPQIILEQPDGTEADVALDEWQNYLPAAAFMSSQASGLAIREEDEEDT